MIRCPRCRHEEYVGALYCSECGAPLFSAGDTTRNLAWSREKEKASSVEPIPDPGPREANPREEAVASQEGYVVLQVLHDRSLQLTLQGKRRWVLGRRTPTTQRPVDMDLTPYQALPLGVSRVHAELEVREDGVFVTDLGSTNGTWVNGVRLPAHQPHPLRHGDVLTLGKLAFQVLLPR